MTNGTAMATRGEELAPGLVAIKDLGGGIVYDVWLAFDQRLLAPVVVKRIRPDQVDDEAAVAGFVREVELLGSLAHPGLPRVFAYDDEAELPYMVLEHIDGPTLSSAIGRDGPVQLHQLLPLALELASATHYLHGEGICHLDIKPSNIILGAPAQLIDLSVALDVPSAAALDHPVGSDEYMAPEQCDPRQFGPVGPASDVWGIGASLFRAAAGFRAWDREPGRLQATTPPKPLPDFVPAAVRELIMACLAFDPAGRPTPAELAGRLEPLLAALPAARLSGFKVRL